jgi:hypothetical protein
MRYKNTMVKGTTKMHVAAGHIGNILTPTGKTLQANIGRNVETLFRTSPSSIPFLL